MSENLYVHEKFVAHTNGECDAQCPYCMMEDELNEEYEYIEQRMSKVASNAKNEKALRKQ